MSLPLPRVYDGTAYTRRLHPTSCRISLNLQPLSTVSMTIQRTEDINTLDWVQVFYPDGGCGYYRVTSVSTDTRTGEKQLYLEHGACLLDGIMIPETGKRKSDSMKDTITKIMTAILAKQDNRQSAEGSAYMNKWTLGTVEATQTVYVELGGMSLMTAMLTLMQQIPQYQIDFVQADETDWHIDIKQRQTVPVCEGRLSRNLVSCDVSYDTSTLCTRVYGDGLTGGKMDSANIQTYGLHEEFMSLNDSLSKAQKETLATAYLAAHDHPSVSISISGVELSQITGLDIDRFTLGTVCRVAIPWLNITEDQVITDKTYSDVYAEPDAVTFTLANAVPDLTIAVANVSGGGGKGVKGLKDRFTTKFEQDKTHFRLLATDTQWDELENGTITAYSQIVQTASAIQTVVSRTGLTVGPFFDPGASYTANDIVIYDGKMYQFTAAHHGAWTGTDVKQVVNMYSSVTQTESKIEQIVENVGADGTVTAASITLAVNANGSNAYINADRIKLTGDTTIDGVLTVTGGNLVCKGEGAGDRGTFEADTIEAHYIDMDTGATIDTTYLNANTVTSQEYIYDDGTLSGADVLDGVKAVQIVQVPNSTDYKLQYKTYSGNTWTDAGTFNRASSVSSVSVTGISANNWQSGSMFTLTLKVTLDDGTESTHTIPLDTVWAASAYDDVTSQYCYKKIGEVSGSLRLTANNLTASRVLKITSPKADGVSETTTQYKVHYSGTTSGQTATELFNK